MRFDPSKKDRFPKLEKGDRPSPGSYEMEKSFEKAKGHNRSFQIPKTKVENFLDQTLKMKKNIPSIGQYDLTKGETFIYKGKKSYR